MGTDDIKIRNAYFKDLTTYMEYITNLNISTISFTKLCQAGKEIFIFFNTTNKVFIFGKLSVNDLAVINSAHGIVLDKLKEITDEICRRYDDKSTKYYKELVPEKIDLNKMSKEELIEYIKKEYK